jgi:hypothetical protein
VQTEGTPCDKNFFTAYPKAPKTILEEDPILWPGALLPYLPKLASVVQAVWRCSTA